MVSVLLSRAAGWTQINHVPWFQISAGNWVLAERTASDGVSRSCNSCGTQFPSMYLNINCSFSSTSLFDLCYPFRASGQCAHIYSLGWQHCFCSPSGSSQTILRIKQYSSPFQAIYYTEYKSAASEVSRAALDIILSINT